MNVSRNALILMVFIIPLLTACSGGGSGTPQKATFDHATFDKSTWE